MTTNPVLARLAAFAAAAAVTLSLVALIAELAQPADAGVQRIAQSTVTLLK